MPPEWQQALFALCVRVTGMVLVVGGVRGLVEVASRLQFFQRAVVAMPPEVWATLLGAAAYLLLGLYLLRGATAFVRWAQGAGAAAGSVKADPSGMPK